MSPTSRSFVSEERRQPTVRGMRYPVGNLLELLMAGMKIEDHPDLERDDLLAVLQLGQPGDSVD